MMCAGLLLLLNYFVPTIPRNNPFNVRNRTKGYYGFVGMDSSDFALFSHWSFGLLGGIDIIRLYQQQGKSVQEMISIFCAGDVSSYIDFVCVNANVHYTDVNWSVPAVAMAMCRFELGFQPFSYFYYLFGYYLTLIIY
jgi:hypothetical protein